MLDPVPITKRFHGSSLTATMFGSAAFYFWPDQGAHLGWYLAAYAFALFAAVKFIHAAYAGIVEANNGSVVSAYEDEIEKLERDKVLLKEKIESSVPEKADWRNVSNSP